MLEYYIVVHGHISGSLVSHVYIVSLLYQTDECTSHRNHIIVRVR